MALSLQLGYPDVPNSITNPNVDKKNALDVVNPLPFITFLKIITVSFEPDTLQDYYNFYLKTWNTIHVTSNTTNENLVVDKYREFIKELSLSYTTLEEKQFLSKIDYNDPFDLDIAISFYSKKLKDLANFFNNKRHDIKFNLIRNKLKGTNLGLVRSITDITLNYLRSLDDGKILYDFNKIEEDLEIEIEELYDAYPFYYNQVPDPKIYDKKDLDYGFGLFLKNNSQIIAYELSDISSELLSLKEIDNLLDNKRKLTQKLVFPDIYYISTGIVASNYTIGKAFEGSNNIGTFFNRNYPTTASTENTCCIKTPRTQGFFRPLNTSIILLDGVNNGYSIDTTKLQPNSLYYFPDPLVSSGDNNFITYIIDDSFLKKGITSGIAKNQPKSSERDTKYYGYVSKIDPNLQKNLDSVFDYGYIQDSKKDIYGNIYGLYNNNGKFESSLYVEKEENRVNMLLNGHQFYDDLYNEGLSFDYTVIDEFVTFDQTIRTGLSSYTDGMVLLNPDVTMFFGKYTPYVELVEPTQEELVSKFVILEGAFISDSNYTPLVETYSTDLMAYEGDSGPYYFTQLIENGVHGIFPYERPLVDPLYPSINANLLISLRDDTVTEFDGDNIINSYNFEVLTSSPEPSYIDQVITPTTFIPMSSLPSDFNGKLMIKNSATKQVAPLLNTFPQFYIKYPNYVTSQLENSIKKFEISSEVLIIETDNYIIFDKIMFNMDQFVDSKLPAIYLEHDTSWYNKISNRFKVNNLIYYCIMDTSTPVLSSKSIILYPKIYVFDSINFTNTKIYDMEIDMFSLSSTGAIFSSLDSPVLSYSSRNNIFKLSFLLKDIHNTPTLVEYDIHISADVHFLERKEFYFNGTSYSTLYDILPPNQQFYLQSTIVNTQSFELVL